MDISNLIEKLISSGLVQSDIALLIGCSQSSVSDMKNGKIGAARPSYHIVDGLKRLAKRRGIPFDIDTSPQNRRGKCSAAL